MLCNVLELRTTVKQWLLTVMGLAQYIQIHQGCCSKQGEGSGTSKKAGVRESTPISGAYDSSGGDAVPVLQHKKSTHPWPSGSTAHLV
jgi:hypothetical protein